MNQPIQTNAAPAQALPPTLQEVLPPQQQLSAPPVSGSASGIDQDLAEFRQAFPQIYELAMRDPKCIPHEVWALVRQGMSLTDAYLTYLEGQQTQNLRNSRRAAGSMRSAGRSTAVTDPFLRGFDS